MIMAFLPPHKILVVQSVCRAWLDAITQSIKIQQLLFRRPSGTPSVPKILKLPQTRFDSPWAYNQELHLNTLIPHMVFTSSIPDQYVRRVKYQIKRRDQEEDLPALAACADTFLFQPPCTAATLDVTIGSSCVVHGDRCELQNASGLKIGAIIDKLRQMASKVCEQGYGLEGQDQMMEVQFCMPVSEGTGALWDAEVQEMVRQREAAWQIKFEKNPNRSWWT